MIKTVFVDSREPPVITQQAFGVPAITMELATGDVWVTTDADELLIFERKAPGDLLQSISDGRLFNQIESMREQTDWAYLVVTGLMRPTPDGYVVADGRETRWNWNAVQGVLAEVQERGVTVWQVSSDAEFGATVQVIAKRDRVNVKPVQPRVTTAKVSPAEAVLMALPGIGYEKAQDLLEEFDNTAALAFAWLTDTHAIGKVSNIGKATKCNVRKALGMTDDMEMVIVPAGKPRVEQPASLHSSLVPAL